MKRIKAKENHKFLKVVRLIETIMRDNKISIEWNGSQYIFSIKHTTQ